MATHKSAGLNGLAMVQNNFLRHSGGGDRLKAETQHRKYNRLQTFAFFLIASIESESLSPVRLTSRTL